MGTGTVSKTPKIKRRQFLAGAMAAGPVAALAATTKSAGAVEAARPSVPAVPQTAGDIHAPSALPRLTTNGKVGGDFMVDCMRSLDIDYVASCPGSTFRGLQESIINYAMNKKPEFITCTARRDLGRDGAWLRQDRRQADGHDGARRGRHAARGSMAIYNAYCDQTPVVVLAGNVGQGTMRRPGVEWAHSAHDQATIVRDYVKWDDQATNLQDFAEGLVRAYDLATTAPMGSGLRRHRRRSAGRRDRRPQPHDPEAAQAFAAGGRFGRPRGSGQDAGRRGEPRDPRRPRPAHRCRTEAARPARRDPAGPRGRRPRAHEHVQPSSAQSHRTRQRRDPRGRRHPRARAV